MAQADGRALAADREAGREADREAGREAPRAVRVTLGNGVRGASGRRRPRRPFALPDALPSRVPLTCKGRCTSDAPIGARRRALDRERRAELLRLRLLRAPSPGAVQVDRQRDRRVPELLLHPGDLGAVLERDPRERVPERVEVALAAALADALDPGPLECRVEHLPESVAAVQVAAVLALEDEPLVAGLGQPGLEQRRRLRRQVDRARLAALRRGDAQAGRGRLAEVELAMQ